MYWWVELGYPDAFDLGRDGFFPRPGQVVKYYRERKMNDKGKAWTQKNLAKTLGLTDNGVRDIENRDIGMDDFGRRQFLGKLFDIPPILLGIVTPAEIAALLEKQRKANNTEVISTPTATSRRHTIDVQEYQERLAGLLAGLHNGQSSMATALASVDELYRELARVSQKQQSDIQCLLCDYHRFLSMEWSEQRTYDQAIEQLNKAFRLAECSDGQKALVFKLRGDTLWKADRVDEALYDFDRAWQFEKKLPNNLRGSILLESARPKAEIATTRQQRTEVLRSIDVVGGIIRANHQEEDPHLVTLDLDCYHLYKSAVLISIGWNKEATEELQIIKGFTQFRMRQVYYDILQAQAYTNRGMYEMVAPLLESALTTALEVNSEASIARIVKLFQQLQKSPYKDSPDVARIDYLLYKKPRVQKP
jgi:tetratricopeptide (TPR) repeat protein